MITRSLFYGIVAAFISLAITGTALYAKGEDAKTGAAKKGHDAKSGATKKGQKSQKSCPIMEGKIDKKLYVDALGHRIYVCCKGCIDAVKKDPAAALKKLAEKGEQAEILQKTCPVLGEPINPKLYAEKDGRRIYVCCKECIAKVLEDFANHEKKVDEEIAKAKADKDGAKHGEHETEKDKGHGSHDHPR